jgi:hypothetical protein
MSKKVKCRDLELKEIQSIRIFSSDVRRHKYLFLNLNVLFFEHSIDNSVVSYLKPILIGFLSKMAKLNVNAIITKPTAGRISGDLNRKDFFGSQANIDSITCIRSMKPCHLLK